MKEPEGAYEKFYFKGIKEPLFFPSDMSQHSLFQVAVECFNPSNWHYYEIPQTRVSAEDIVADCGAAEGLFALVVHPRCRQLYLIEPLQKFVDSLGKTFKEVRNVDILPVAISDQEFTATMNSHDISSSLSMDGAGEEVQVTTLDKLFFDRGIPVTYLKMDLEGYDYKALLGARNLIQKHRPKIAITTYHDKDHAMLIQRFLHSLVPEYKILCKGIYQETGSPVMLHAWV